MRKLFLVFSIIFNVVACVQLSATSLDGTVGASIFQDEHYVFRNTDFARGHVRLDNGFTCLSGETTLDTWVSLKGDINLRGGSIIVLENMLTLDPKVTFTTSGRIDAQGNVVALSSDMMLSGVALHFCSDGILDGGGCTLNIENNAQLFVDHMVTLTLKNMTLKFGKNCETVNYIQLADNSTNIAFDNVHIRLSDDFVFDKGHFFVHNDVVVTGTHQFIYKSPVKSYVAPCSTLAFDKKATLCYAPKIADKDLICLPDKTSQLYFNECSILYTTTGFRLTKGTVCFDNRTTVTGKAGRVFDSISGVDSIDFTETQTVHEVKWSPDGKYLVSVGIAFQEEEEEESTIYELQVYSFDGLALSLVAVADFGQSSAEPFTVDWSPDGKLLAVGGFEDYEVSIYSFQNDTLSLVETINYDTADGAVCSVKWSSDGKFLAIAGSKPSSTGGFANNHELRIYRFNGGASVATASQDYCDSTDKITSLDWSADGKYIAVGGKNPTTFGGNASTDELQIYHFDGQALIPVTSEDYGFKIGTVAWSPCGIYLAIGGMGPTAFDGGANSDELQIYSFDGTSLAAVTSEAFGNELSWVGWSPCGKYLALGGRNPSMFGGSASSDEFQIYQFENGLLTPLVSRNYGVAESNIAGLDWSSDGNFIAIGGHAPTVFDGNASSDEVQVYEVSYIADETSPNLQCSFVLGNQAAGEDHDVTAELLAGAKVIVNGALHYDNVG